MTNELVCKCYECDQIIIKKHNEYVSVMRGIEQSQKSTNEYVLWKRTTGHNKNQKIFARYDGTNSNFLGTTRTNLECN